MEDLSSLSELQFELRRRTLIREYIDLLPEHQRKKAISFQLQLDLKRLELGSKGFIDHCFAEINENLLNLSDQFVCLKNLTKL